VPEVTTVLSEGLAGRIRVERIRFRSFEGTSDGGVTTNEIFAVIARPITNAVRSLPGILLCHCGDGSVQEWLAIEWAKLGFVAITPEFPGWVYVAGMESISRHRTVDGSQWHAVPNARASTLFDGMVAGLGAFNLLEDMDEVDPEKLYIHGVSLGGYATTMLCGLLDVRVKRAFSLFGCGFFLDGTLWESFIRAMSEAERQEWMKSLDAGARIDRVRATMLYYVPSNDRFFPPPAFNRTYDEIQSPKYICVAPNNSHVFTTLPGGMLDTDGLSWTSMERLFMLNGVDGIERPLPKVYRGERKARTVKIHIAGLNADGEVWGYYSKNLEKPWTERLWERLQVLNATDGYEVSFFRRCRDGRLVCRLFVRLERWTDNETGELGYEGVSGEFERVGT
jgi:cephalosporin-C deacetylase-like acetyl esterase